MSRAVKQALLQPLFAKLEPGSNAWVQRVQATADQVFAVLADPGDLTDGQFAAVASLADSITVATFTGSTLNRLLDAGNYAMALQEFPKWLTAGDPPVADPTLPARRAAEQAIYLS